jgi:hypothetical protein
MRKKEDVKRSGKHSMKKLSFTEPRKINTKVQPFGGIMEIHLFLITKSEIWLFLKKELMEMAESGFSSQSSP